MNIFYDFSKKLRVSYCEILNDDREGGLSGALWGILRVLWNSLEHYGALGIAGAFWRSMGLSGASLALSGSFWGSLGGGLSDAL